MLFAAPLCSIMQLNGIQFRPGVLFHLTSHQGDHNDECDKMFWLFMKGKLGHTVTIIQIAYALL